MNKTTCIAECDTLGYSLDSITLIEMRDSVLIAIQIL
jgi:hypothetical protein